MVYKGQSGEYAMPWRVSEAWLKEHGCALRDLGEVSIPFVWMPDGDGLPEFEARQWAFRRRENQL